jgi:hypothetical protein
MSRGVMSRGVHEGLRQAAMAHTDIKLLPAQQDRHATGALTGVIEAAKHPQLGQQRREPSTHLPSPPLTHQRTQIRHSGLSAPVARISLVGAPRRRRAGRAGGGSVSNTARYSVTFEYPTLWPGGVHTLSDKDPDCNKTHGNNATSAQRAAAAIAQQSGSAVCNRSGSESFAFIMPTRSREGVGRGS